MSRIVSEGAPSVRIQKIIHSVINCPNCAHDMALDPAVSQGNVVECEACKAKTYYPFERPWRRNGKAIALYVVGLAVSFLLGIAVNATYDLIKSGEGASPANQTHQKGG